jgi:hypothetical protein
MLAITSNSFFGLSLGVAVLEGDNNPLLFEAAGFFSMSAIMVSILTM